MAVFGLTTPARRIHLPALLRASVLFVAAWAGLLPPLKAADAPTSTAPRTAAQIAAELCIGCHGPNLAGGNAPNLLDTIWEHGSSDAEILRSIRDGFPVSGMPPFGLLLAPPEQVALVTYLRNQARRFAFGLISYPAPPDAVVFKSEHQEFRLETVAGPLDNPWGLVFLNGSDMLVTERIGTLRKIENGRLLPEPIRGLPKVYVRQDGGMLDVTIHPDYANNGWIYLAYSEATGETQSRIRPPSMTVIIRGRIRDGEWIDQETIFRAAPEFYYEDDSHYGSRFLWDEAGHLFFTLGERGRPPVAQDLGNPLGKIHRIHDDGRIPADNPFAHRQGAIASIWSYGHRHVQGLQFSPVTGKMWATEHGPIGGDELNLIEPGRNYGWPVISYGTPQIGETIEGAARDGMEQPKAWWSPSVAPSGMMFYTGDRYPAWKNNLFIALLFGRHLRRVVIEGDNVVHQEVVFSEMGRVRTAVQGPDGLLYVLLANPGRVARLVPVEPGTYALEQAALEAAAAADRAAATDAAPALN